MPIYRTKGCSTFLPFLCRFLFCLIFSQQHYTSLLLISHSCTTTSASSLTTRMQLVALVRCGALFALAHGCVSFTTVTVGYMLPLCAHNTTPSCDHTACAFPYGPRSRPLPRHRSTLLLSEVFSFCLLDLDLALRFTFLLSLHLGFFSTLIFSC